MGWSPFDSRASDFPNPRVSLEAQAKAGQLLREVSLPRKGALAADMWKCREQAEAGADASTLAYMSAVHRVAVVVAPTFTTELEQLVNDRHVWALHVPEYERVAEERWATARGDDVDSGITLFKGGGLSPEAEFVEVFPTIEEHHGEDSQSAALSEIEVFGAQPTSAVRAELSAYGFDTISLSQRGFTARRNI